MYYTYVLISLVDKKLYIGYTGNLKRRINEHFNGSVEATHYRRPLKLIYYEACLNESKAREREIYFKSGFGHGFLKNRI